MLVLAPVRSTSAPQAAHHLILFGSYQDSAPLFRRTWPGSSCGSRSMTWDLVLQVGAEEGGGRRGRREKELGRGDGVWKEGW